MRVGLRTRLTLIYGSLFFLTGAVLLTVTYVLTAQAMNSKFKVTLITKGAGRVDATYGIVPPEPSAQMSALVQATRQRIEAQKHAVLMELLQRSLLATLVLGLLAVVLGYLLAGRSLRPLKTMTATARRLSESNLHERIALDGPKDEIKELADTFDGMLDRLHRAFDSQRRFVANASHELRTPLTINRTVLEVALASPRSPAETKQLSRTLLGTTARHERLIEGLLLLARSERELDRCTPVALPDAARSAVDQLGERAAEAEVTITAELAPATAAGDPVLLERCATNLVENGIKYNITGGWVLVRTCHAGDAAILHVENTGPYVPPGEVPALFEPFRRLRADRVGSAKGSGLGLSIVRAVVRAHGGTIETVPRRTGGLAVTVRLPAGHNCVVRG